MGYELNRLMRQYGVSTPSMARYSGAVVKDLPESATAEEKAANQDAAKRAEYDKKIYENYKNEYQNRLRQGDVYNQAQFMKEPAKFTPQFPTQLANPAYAPTNYSDISNIYNKYFNRPAEEAGVQYWGNTGLKGDALKGAILGGAQGADAVTGIYNKYFNRPAEESAIKYWTGTNLTGDKLKSAIIGGAQGDDVITGTYNKYFGRAPDQPGMEYWKNFGLQGNDLQKAILRGAQNSDLDYFQKNFPNYLAPTTPAPQPGGDGYMYIPTVPIVSPEPQPQPGTGGNVTLPVMPTPTHDFIGALPIHKWMPYDGGKMYTADFGPTSAYGGSVTPPVMPTPLPGVGGVPGVDTITNTYNKYFGRAPEQAGMEYWSNIGLQGNDLQKAILRGAQNSDLTNFQQNFPDYQFARGGAVKTRYAEGGEIDPNAIVQEPLPPPSATYESVVTASPITSNKDVPLETMASQYQVRPGSYSRELAEARRRSQTETEAFANMIRQMSERTESPTSRAEMYFRLASAFGAPSKTGMFAENLALAGREMGEYAKGRRADEAERRALALRGQEVRMATAREDVETLKGLAARELQGPNERERRINDIMSTHNVDRRTASNIVDGIESVVTDPVTGMPTIVNRITNQSRRPTMMSEQPSGASGATGATGATAQAPVARQGDENQRPTRTLYDLARTPFTTGIGPAAAEGAQRILGQVGVNPVPPEFTERRQTFLNVQNDIIRAVINNPRFPVAEQERIRREINIEPGAFTDPQTLLSKIRTLDTTLRTSLANREREGDDTSLPAEARRGARQAANDIRNLLATLGVPQEREEPEPTTSPRRRDSSQRLRTPQQEGWSIQPIE